MSVSEATPPDGVQGGVLPTLLQEDLLIQLEGDYAESSSFGLRTLEVTLEIVRVRETNGMVAFQIPVSEIKEARNEPLVGGGRLEITAKNGDFFPIITYSSTVSAQFSEAARGIEQLSKGEPLSINLKQERTRCAKCNRLLPEKDGICPACVNRTKTMGRIAQYLRPYRKQAITLTLLSLVMTGLSLAPPAIQGALIDGVLTPHRNLGLLWTLMALWLVTLAINSAVQIMNGRLIAFLAGS
ncbi:MAG: Lipid export ATP-binding/permease protein MsbA, partial [Chthonomonadaceae bacterium]|nr:Lipid export ATP-binding/permease protein MsbA [Chthonomonadaceae bacterium]